MTRATAAPAPSPSAPDHPWLHRRAIVLASAGTGKTYALTARYLHALLAPRGTPPVVALRDRSVRAPKNEEHWSLKAATSGAHATAPPGCLPEPSTLLATTFTRKAAGEILDRILKRLLEAESDPAKLTRLCQDLRLNLDAAACRRAAAELGRRLDRVRIMTIDSMMQRMARAAALALHTAPGWTIADEADLKDLHARAIHEALDDSEGEDPAGLVAMLRGSTRNPLSRQVFHALDRTVQDAHRAFEESTGDAALWSVVAPATQPLDPQALASAIVTLGRCPAPLNRSEQPDSRFIKAIEKCLECARRGDWEALVCEGLGSRCLDGATYYNVPVPPALAAALTPLLDHARCLILTRLAERNRATAALLARYDAARKRLRARTGLMSFSDITQLLVEANVAGALDDLWYRLDGALHHLLIDEAQDTSLIQYRLIHPILAELLSADDDRGVLVVGDVKQSLYGWRQAEPELLPAIRDSQPGLRCFPLSVSHRSSQVVLDAVNDLFGALTANPALDPVAHPGAAQAAEAFARDFHPHAAAPHADAPGLVLLKTHAWRDPDAQRKSPDIERGAAEAVELLLSDVLAGATGRVAWPRPGVAMPGLGSVTDSRLSDAEPSPRHPTPDIAVLVRRNKFIRPIIAALRAHGIQASEEGGAPLADDPAVAATLSLLHLADHPTDELARFHVAMSPLGAALNWNGVPSPASTRRRAAKLRRALATRGYAHVLERLLDRAAPHIPPASAARMDQLLDLARDFDARACLRPCEFVSLVCEQRVAHPGGSRVRVMSIHAAKGLEFDAVVLPDLDAPSCPPGGCLADRPGGTLDPARALSLAVSRDVARLHPLLEGMHRQREKRLVFEDLCTLYVAMTRAKRALVMLVSPYKQARKGDLTLRASSILRGCLDDWQAPAEERTQLRAWTRDGHAWWEGLAPSPAQDAPSRVGPSPAADLTLAPPRPGSLRRARVLAPSSLEGGGLIDLAERLAPTGAAGSLGVDIGTIVHTILERIEWLDDAMPTKDTLRAAASTILTPSARDTDTAVAIVLRFLGSPAAACLRRVHHHAHPALAADSAGGLQQVPQHGGGGVGRVSASSTEGAAAMASSAPDHTLDLRREWTFLHEDPAADPPRLISGAIDRLVLLRRGAQVIAADILDYKSDTIVSDTDLASRTAHYRPQLLAYAASVARMFNLPPGGVRATLVFLGAATTVEIR